MRTSANNTNLDFGFEVEAAGENFVIYFYIMLVLSHDDASCDPRTATDDSAIHRDRGIRWNFHIVIDTDFLHWNVQFLDYALQSVFTHHSDNALWIDLEATKFR